MALQIINLGTLADGSDGDTNKVAWGKAKDNFAELYGRVVGKGYISGFQMKWVSGTALTLTSGAAYIEGTGSVLFSDSDIAKTGLSLAANTWYHVYPFDNAGTPDFILSTTAPATPYNGTARSMTGDSGKRYVGSVKTDASGNIRSFKISGSHYMYRDNGVDGTPFNLILNNGMATAKTTVSLASLVPEGGAFAKLRVNNTSSVAARIGAPDDNSSGNITSINGNTQTFLDTPVDDSQAITYYYGSSPTNGLYISVTGYIFER
jgi:hypothetical protein